MVRGSLVMMGYYKDPAATAEAGRHGWHHTGDIGRIDDDGFLYIVDRAKDMIISGGFNVYSVEVEQALMQHPDVQDSAVIGLPDDKWGEKVVAVLQLHAGRRADPQEIQAFVKARIGSVKTPKLVEIWPDLPRSKVGKVLKKDIRAEMLKRATEGASMSKAFVAGVGMIPFAKPGASEPYHRDGAPAAGRLALADAGIGFDALQQAYVGLRLRRLHQRPEGAVRARHDAASRSFNVNNNCSTGSTALFLARQAIESGAADCVLALGFEQMNPGALGTVFNDRPSPFEDFDREAEALVGMPELPLALRYFGGAGLAHMQKYGTPLEAFAQVRAKASRHAARNPLALLRKELTVDDVMNAPMLWPGVLTRLMACPPTCGAAAAVLVSEAVRQATSACAPMCCIAAQAMTTDRPDSFDSHDMMKLVGYDMSKAAARMVYEQAGIGPDDLDVVELHDCFAQNELISYEALGLCPEGEAAAFIDAGDNTYGGQVVTNPSGGLLSKGHPLGATGLAQCFELTHQLRGSAEQRQVDGARIGLQHNLGLGGACVVTLYQAA